MLVEIEELKTRLDEESLVLLYSQLTPIGVQVHADVPSYIPGSRVFNIEEFSATEVSLPHMLLPEGDFNRKAKELGINTNSKIYVYDDVGIYSSPRAWFNLKLMGCENVAIVNGGIVRWKKFDYQALQSAVLHNPRGNFRGRKNADMVASMEYVQSKISCQSCKIIDVRSEDRFNGVVPEPRQGVRRGHIPNSVNLPFSKLLHEQRYKEKHDLLRLFDDAGALGKEEIIFLCGSGVTACIAYFAAHLCGLPGIKLYDGSWAEWGSTEGLPIETYLNKHDQSGSLR